MTRSNLLTAGVLVLALAAAPAVRAQDNTTDMTQTQTMSDQTVNGTIVSTTGDVVVITTDSGQRMTFTRDAAFTLPSGLVAGNRVTVTYRGADPSAYTVNRIVMVDNTTGASGTYGTTTDNTGTSTYSTSDTDLPGTASPVPLVGLLGALTLGAGAAIRAIRRR